MQPGTLFAPERYRNVRKPLLEASCLPPDCYTADSFYQREVDRVFKRHWQFVGREEQLAEPGSFICFDGPAGPLVVLRDEQGVLRAYANSCRHRGARLLQGQGHCKRIVCPYHSWTYRLDGRLQAAPGMQQSIDFKTDDFPLVEFPLACWGGFIFVNYQASPPDFNAHLGNLPIKFGGHRCEQMRLVGELEFDIASNWKLLAENALEAYHTGSVHRDTLGQQDSRAIDAHGNWTGLLVEDEHSVATLSDGDSFPHIDDLGGEAAEGAYFTLLYPSTQFVFAQDCAWWLDFKPLAVDRTRLTIGACFPQSTIDSENFEERVKPYFERWRLATMEDNDICEQQQLGQAATSTLR